MLFNLYLPETTSQLPRKPKVRTRSCDTLTTSDLTYHDLDAAAVVYSYAFVNREDQDQIKDSAIQRRNPSRSNVNESIGAAAGTFSSKRDRRKNQVSSRTFKAETTRMPNDRKVRPQQQRPREDQKPLQRAETTREHRRQSIFQEPTPEGMPRGIKDIFKLRRNDTTSKKTTTKESKPKQDVPKPHRHDRRSSAYIPPTTDEPSRPTRHDRQSGVYVPPTTDEPPRPARHDRPSSLYVPPTTDGPPRPTRHDRQSRLYVPPTTEPSRRTSRPVSMVSAAEGPPLSHDDPREVSPIRDSPTPPRLRSSAPHRPSARPRSMVPGDVAFANEAEFQLFLNATAGLGGFDEEETGDEQSNDPTTNPSSLNPSLSRTQHVPVANAAGMPSDPSSHRRGVSSDAILSSEYPATTASAMQQLGQMPQSMTPRQIRPTSRPVSTIYSGAPTSPDVVSWGSSARPQAWPSSGADIRRSQTARLPPDPSRITRPSQTRNYLYDSDEDAEFHNMHNQPLRGHNQPLSGQTQALSGQNQPHGGHNLGPGDSDLAFRRNEFLPDYAQSQAEAQERQRAAATRRAEELAQKWRQTGRRRGH